MNSDGGTFVGMMIGILGFIVALGTVSISDSVDDLKIAYLCIEGKKIGADVDAQCDIIIKGADQ